MVYFKSLLDAWAQGSKKVSSTEKWGLGIQSSMAYFTSLLGAWAQGSRKVTMVQPRSQWGLVIQCSTVYFRSLLVAWAQGSVKVVFVQQAWKEVHLFGDLVELLRLSRELVRVAAMPRTDSLQVHLHWEIIFRRVCKNSDSYFCFFLKGFVFFRVTPLQITWNFCAIVFVFRWRFDLAPLDSEMIL